MTAAVENVELVRANEPGLPAAVVKRNISEAQWRTLFNLFPGARAESALMVWDYCVARKLDPLKKPCHIVPMRVKNAASGQWEWRDVVMPGIYEYRITAQRTGLYLGHTTPEYGPEIEHLGVKAPAWCAMTFYRWNSQAREKVPYPVVAYFTEVVGTRDKKVGDKGEVVEVVNERWGKAPIQMLTKCTEAAGLREAFPEELGGETTAEEMDGQRTIEDAPTVSVTSLPQPGQRVQQGYSPTPTQPGQPPTSNTAVVTPAAPAQVVAPATEPEPPRAQEQPAHIGRIADIKELDSGAAFVTLDTAFVAGTRAVSVINDAKEAREMGAIVELVHRAPADPKFRPTLLEVKARLDLMDGQS